MPPRKILVLSFYYPPDLCAGSFRAGAFIAALQRKLGPATEIDVLTTMPNRYHSYLSEAPPIERTGPVTVYRFDIGEHKSGFKDQSLCFGRFGRQVLRHVRNRNYDLAFSTSSRLLTAALAATVARKKRIPLYLDIRDIFTDTMKDVLRPPIRWVALPLFEMLERYTMRSAAAINLVSKGFEDHFRPYASGERPLRFFSNGIDPEFLAEDFSPSEVRKRKSILVAGNIGEGQGLEKIIPQAADLVPKDYDLVVIGDGGTKQRLVDACRGKENVVLLPPVSRRELIKHYADADILLMHLNDYDAFRKVLPSKIFEYAATGKPILAGVAGYAAEFTEREVDNAVVFPPCDAQAMVAGVEQLDPDVREREDFKSKFAREAIMASMADDVLSFAG
jgi:glycosyltransferase involved in cell wall biosynthesis